MATDFTVVLEDSPGTLAALGKALGAAGINIDGFCGFPCEGRGVIHLLVGEAAAARPAIEAAGLEIRDERQVLLFEAEDRPGMLGEVAARIAAAGVNIDLIYKATQKQIVIGADDLDEAKAAI